MSRNYISWKIEVTKSIAATDVEISHLKKRFCDNKRCEGIKITGGNMFCSKCGRQLREGAKFCAGCGAQVVYRDRRNDVVMNKETEKEKEVENVTCPSEIKYDDLPDYSKYGEEVNKSCSKKDGEIIANRIKEESNNSDDGMPNYDMSENEVSENEIPENEVSENEIPENDVSENEAFEFGKEEQKETVIRKGETRKICFRKKRVKEKKKRKKKYGFVEENIEGLLK